MRLHVLGILIATAMLGICGCTHVSSPAAVLSSNPAAYQVGPLMYSDSFDTLQQWQTECEAPAEVRAADHRLDIDTPKGCTVWFTRALAGPVLIRYEARLVRADPPGQNDRVSDLNCFWMATDARPGTAGPDDFLHVPARTGAFATYNQLRTYYVGQGGNTNTTTRFRRYIGDATNRPILPEHDLSAKEFMLTPNVWQTVTLVACDHLIEYYRDGRRVFSYVDPAPYTHGYFGIRTTQNHLQIRNLEIYRVAPISASDKKYSHERSSPAATSANVPSSVGPF